MNTSLKNTSLRNPLRSWNQKDTLLFGIGNSGRSDDGLGWAFLDAIDGSKRFKGTIQYRYQLQVEDAELISKYRQVIFVDAHKGNLAKGFEWKEVDAINNVAFTSHILSPETILFLTADLYEQNPKASVLMIEGCQWGLRKELSAVARTYLKNAINFFYSNVLDF